MNLEDAKKLKGRIGSIPLFKFPLPIKVKMETFHCQLKDEKLFCFDLKSPEAAMFENIGHWDLTKSTLSPDRLVELVNILEQYGRKYAATHFTPNADDLGPAGKNFVFEFDERSLQ